MLILKALWTDDRAKHSLRMSDYLKEINSRSDLLSGFELSSLGSTWINVPMVAKISTLLVPLYCLMASYVWQLQKLA